MPLTTRRPGRHDRVGAEARENHRGGLGQVVRVLRFEAAPPSGRPQTSEIRLRIKPPTFGPAQALVRFHSPNHRTGNTPTWGHVLPPFSRLGALWTPQEISDRSCVPADGVFPASGVAGLGPA